MRFARRQTTEITRTRFDVFVLAGHQEAHGVCRDRIHLDHSVNVCDDRWYSEHGHHQGKLYTVGRSQQLCCRENNHFSHLLHRTCGATDNNGCLLFQNRLQTQTLGIHTRVSLKLTSCFISSTTPAFWFMINITDLVVCFCCDTRF